MIAACKHRTALLPRHPEPVVVTSEVIQLRRAEDVANCVAGCLCAPSQPCACLSVTTVSRGKRAHQLSPGQERPIKGAMRQYIIGGKRTSLLNGGPWLPLHRWHPRSNIQGLKSTFAPANSDDSAMTNAETQWVHALKGSPHGCRGRPCKLSWTPAAPPAPATGSCTSARHQTQKKNIWQTSTLSMRARLCGSASNKKATLLTAHTCDACMLGARNGRAQTHIIAGFVLATTL